MNRIEAFILALKKWDESVVEKTMGLTDIIYLAGHGIGVGFSDDNPLNAIEEKINEILKETDIDEGFLIRALINEVTYMLKHNFENVNNAIQINEKILRRAIDANQSKIAETIQKVLERIKEPNFILISKQQLKVWEETISGIFTPENNQRWDDEVLLNFRNAIKK